MIITYTAQIVNVSAKIQRTLYTIEQGREVCKSSFKHQHKLTHKRVANGPLFNNDSLAYPHGDTCTIGLKFNGNEYKHQVPYVWRKDGRGNLRRYITRKQFQLLPDVLRYVAGAMGVAVDGALITFSRCIAAWAGHNVTDMHVHHVNMNTQDDRLGNLWVLTAGDHAAVHSDKGDLLWDKDWHEYSSGYGGMLQLDMAVTISDDDIAVSLKEPALYSLGAVCDMLQHSLEYKSELYPTAASYFVDCDDDDCDDDLSAVISS
ncbi:hypothetical protein [Microcoleus phage My-WqHQDG]|nr:hypothetical protein [Microcoleus phage My-WqHQDG]